jgi:hypothetical protein
MHSALAERLDKVGRGIDPENFGSLLDPLMRDELGRGFREAGAHEGTVWLPDAAEEHLVPAYNTGPNASQLVNRFKQPLHTGLVCMTFALEQPFLENEVFRNSRHSAAMDTHLGVQTYAMMVVPFHFLRVCRGVVSCVQLKKPGSTEPDPPGFQPVHLSAVQCAVCVLGRLLEFKLLADTVGWSTQ